MKFKKIRIYTQYLIASRNLFALYLLSLAFVSIIYSCFVVYIYPKYYKYIEDVYTQRSTEAAGGLSRAFIGPGHLSLLPFPADIEASIKRVVSSGLILKVKVFDLNGKCLFSTQVSDVGTIHEGDEFKRIVATGMSYSKVVRKSGTSLEGEVATIDVSETYVPVFVDGKVFCVFEVYADVSHEQRGIQNLAFTSLGVISILMIFGWIFFTYLMARLALVERKRTKLDKILKRKNANLNERVSYQKDEIEVGHQIAVKALATLAEYNDTDTGSHLNRTKHYVVALATELSRTGKYSCSVNERPVMIEELGLASLLHDIGKVAIPKEILAKPEHLTSDEFNLMQKHSVVAGEILGKANALYREQFGEDSYLALAQEIALYHHERWDGKGYPVGLTNTDIPLSARIVAIADVYDALRSQRPYKAPWTHEKALREIVSGRNSQFDPTVVDAFVSVQKEFDDIFENK
ncbi:HD-GYP domain-containing protein [Fundidesulfovibrio putealis]|uniref:HD-GYP domain-containing protein n=1 Tax=Fundidesulfovibrio putealis TaxID=270496 RepID=UPI00146FB4E8|nr:HD domain-containing phosphohydrolase [Fundidesulfovibrio putealis]